MTACDFWMVFAGFLYRTGEAFSKYMIGVRMFYIGLSKEEIMWVLAAMGMIGLVRVVPCYVIDRLDLNRIVTAGVFTFVLGASTMISVTFTTFPLMMVFGVFFGFCQCKLMQYLPVGTLEGFTSK